MNAYKRLKSLRKSRNLSQKEMGELIGTSGNYYGDYENERNKGKIEQLIADLLESQK